jgi:hypothetical protein
VLQGSRKPLGQRLQRQMRVFQSNSPFQVFLTSYSRPKSLLRDTWEQ